jgi:hypothetical protein
MAHSRLRSALSGRGFLLFPAAAFAVHQLRYELAYGSHAGQALSAQGHGYLNSLAPWVAVLLAIALGSFVGRVARAAAGAAEPRSRRSFTGLWLLASACLVAAYAVQEWLEGLFAAGHPGGLGGIFGHGGWWAVVLSGVFGLIVAGLLRLAFELVSFAGRRRVAGPVRHQPVALPRPGMPWLARRAPLADASAGRAPPRPPAAAVA